MFVNYYVLNLGFWNIMYNLYINFIIFIIIVKVFLYWYDNCLFNVRIIEKIIRKVWYILRKMFVNGNIFVFLLNFFFVNNKWV